MIPETILDHELRVGTYLKGRWEDFVITSLTTTTVAITPVPVGETFELSLAYVETDIANGYIEIPQATYCIWDTPTCTCGAAHTSYPNLHMRFCGEYK